MIIEETNTCSSIGIRSILSGTNDGLASGVGSTGRLTPLLYGKTFIIAGRVECALIGGSIVGGIIADRRGHTLRPSCYWRVGSLTSGCAADKRSIC